VKVKVVLLALAAGLLFASPAQGYFYVKFGPARKDSKFFVQAECEANPECRSWKVGHCWRISLQRVDCGAAIGLRKQYCSFGVENRVGKHGSGRLVQRRYHRRCYLY
jgi:hypothetical protein